MEGIESEGKTVAEAVENALKRLGLRRDQVEVQILQEASSGFLGLGAKPARVRITEKRWTETPAQETKAEAHKAKSRGAAEKPAAPRASHNAAPPAARPGRAEAVRGEIRPAPARRSASAAEPSASPEEQPARAPVDTQAACAQALALLKEILGLIPIEAAVATVWDDKQERVQAAVEGPEAQHLVGKDGKTLESLQFLLTLMVSRRLSTPVAVQVDALGYWGKREKEILSEAQLGIQEVKSTGKPFRLTPMDAAMRRLVHRSLVGHPDVVTASEGEGSWRKVVIRPRKG